LRRERIVELNVIRDEAIDGRLANFVVNSRMKNHSTIRGDMYILDMANTRGHVASINDGRWHPQSEALFITASQDGTIRQWDCSVDPVGIDS